MWTILDFDNVLLNLIFNTWNKSLIVVHVYVLLTMYFHTNIGWRFSYILHLVIWDDKLVKWSFMMMTILLNVPNKNLSTKRKWMLELMSSFILFLLAKK